MCGMTTLDLIDFGFLLDMYLWAPTWGEIDQSAPRLSTADVRKRMDKLRQCGLCLEDDPDMLDEGEPVCWALTDVGETVVDAWDVAGRPDTWEL